jgi:hypothetical protein
MVPLREFCREMVCSTKIDASYSKLQTLIFWKNRKELDLAHKEGTSVNVCQEFIACCASLGPFHFICPTNTGYVGT